MLTALLGGDRQASRNELRKLALYAHGKGEVSIDDVMAVVADASELKLDPIVDGAFAGRPDLVESEFAKAMIAGTYPGVIISAAQRQAAWLHKSALAVAEGTPVSTLLESGYPRLHFSRKGAVEIALRNFSAARLVGDHRAARDRRARHAQAGVAGGRDRAAHAAVDRGECEAAGMSSFPDGHSGMRVIAAQAKQSISQQGVWIRSRFARPGMTEKLAHALRQPPHHFVELFEVAVADLDGAAGIAVIDGDGKAKRVADALFQRHRIGVLCSCRRRAPSAACAPARPRHAPAPRPGAR